MSDDQAFVTPLQLLDALRAGPLDQHHVEARFGTWPVRTIRRLCHAGHITRTVERGSDVTLEATPVGLATLPTRRALASSRAAEIAALASQPA